MNSWFRTLFSLSVRHEYYQGSCRDFDFLVPDKTRRSLLGGRLLAKSATGVLYCVCEADDTGTALEPLAGTRLCFGMKLKNPHFSNFTEPEVAGQVALYRNRAAPDQLDPALGVRLTGATISHQIGKASRPVTLVLQSDTGTSLQTDAVTEAGQDSISYKSGALKNKAEVSAGHFTIREEYAVGSEDAHYYLEPEWFAAGLFGIVEIALDDSFYAAPPVFEIPFKARQQTLRYYVVANKKYTDADFAKLKVSDQGFGEQNRGEVKFTRVTPSDFAKADLDPALISESGEKVALFKSDTMQARQQAPRRKIQLSSNNDVLIPHLPGPTAEKASADLIIHVAKPNP